MRKKSAINKLSTFSPGCSDAGVLGPTLSNWRARKPSSWDTSLRKRSLTKTMENYAHIGPHVFLGNLYEYVFSPPVLLRRGTETVAWWSIAVYQC